MAAAKNFKKGNNCQISEETNLENVTCGNDVVINEGVQLKNIIIGNGTKISRNITLYSPNSEKPIIIGKDVWLSNGVYGEATGGKITIDDYSVIAHFTTLLTSSGPGEKSKIMNEIYPVECGDIHINKHCWIGAHSVVLPFVTLPEGTVIASNSLARKQEYKSWSVYAGNPALFKKSFDPKYIEELKKKHNFEIDE